MSAHESLSTEFTDLTGCPSERARFFLESHNWDLSTALETFFNSEEARANAEAMEVDRDNDAMDYIRQGVQRVTVASAPANPTTKTDNGVSAARSEKMSGQTGAQTAARNTMKAGNDDEDNSRIHEFHVGPGQEVVGPKNKKRKLDEIIGSNGADAADNPWSRGRLTPLGAAGVNRNAPSKEVQDHPGPRTPAGGDPAPTSSTTGQQSRLVVLRMWRNGFTIDLGDLRLYTDFANQELLENIRQGRVPSELVHGSLGKDSKVQVEDHRDKDYGKPNLSMQCFPGPGKTLGSPAPPGITGTVPKSTQSSSEDQREAVEMARFSVSIDSSRPITNLQIRLGDGSRLVQVFNEMSTVGDLRRFIRAARPEYRDQNFQILAGYPPRPVNDDQQSLTEANLLKTAIIVK